MPDIRCMDDLQTLVRQGNTDWRQYGEVRSVRWHDLILFDYMQSAEFAGRWNWFERNSRGLILNAVTGEVVARPFAKFWNYGQRMPMPNSHIVEATEKVDGSLGILFRHDGGYRIATRGAFESPQALWATEYLNRCFNLSDLPDNLTLLFEIIYPANRVVVNYGDLEDLLLIGGIEMDHGRDLYYRELEVITDRYGFNQPIHYTMQSVKDYFDLAEQLTANEEGFVLRYSNGERFKVKGEAYRVAHKLITGVSFNRVLEAMQAGVLEMWLEDKPDEFLGTIRGYQRAIQQVFDATLQECRVAFGSAPRDSKKEFALWVMREHPQLQQYLFAM